VRRKPMPGRNRARRVSANWIRSDPCAGPLDEQPEINRPVATRAARDPCPVDSVKASRGWPASVAPMATGFPIWYCGAMKRRLRKLLIVLAAIVLVLVVSAFGLYQANFGNLAPMTDADVQPGVHVARMGFVSAFIVEVEPGQVLLVDTGVEPDGKTIHAALRTRGLGPESVRAIFLTHGHGDHIAATRTFPSAQVFALECERALIAGQIAPRSLAGHLQRPKPTGIELTRGLKDGESVQIGPVEVRAFAVPGHTAGSGAYLVRDTIFIGDAASLSKSGSIVGPMWIFSEDAEMGRQSLRQLGTRLQAQGSTVRAVAFAHSGRLVGDGAMALAQLH
jgi:hydroxyacylglutathione hydrolase